MEKLILECIADGLDNYVMDFEAAGPPPAPDLLLADNGVDILTTDGGDSLING